MFKRNNDEDKKIMDNNESEEDLRDTIIAQGVRVEGDFNSKGNVIIEGSVVGSVKTNNDLHVGERAKISASVSAKDAFIAGEIQGNIKVREKLELAPTSRVYGDIEAKILIINAGAIMNGKCVMHDPNAPSGIKEKKAKKEDALEEAVV